MCAKMRSRHRAAGALLAIAVLVALPLCSAGQHQRDFYSSVSNLLDLVEHEKEVRLMLLAYAERLITLHSNILSFVTTRQPYHDLETHAEVADYMKHPVHAFHLMKRMIVDLGFVESQINELRASDPLPNITAMRANRLLPWEEDFNGIAVSLARLQDTYLLDMLNLVNGHLTITSGPRNRTVPGRIPLTARDCFFMGQVAVHNGYYDRSVEWVERAIDKVANEKPPSIPTEDLTKYLDLLIKKHDDVLDSMGKAGHHWQTYGVPVSERYKKPLQFQTKLFVEQLTSAQEAQNYKRLCRGEQLRTPKMDSQLRCRYFYGKDGFLRLQPVKIEEANLNPYIITFHDIIGDRDINDLIAFATPRLSRSTHYGAQGMETSLIRTSSNAWLGDEDAPVATRLNRFVESLLGLGTHYHKAEAEFYQLANYGVGGQYIAHHDFLADILSDPNRQIDDFERTAGDRVATLMFYLSDVEEGGATVFPHLGVRLRPKKGNAAFWWNLNADGEGEQLTKHGGCPVLYGSKWIANKWFHSNSNMFRLPCPRNRSQPLAPLV
ncbi:prolyl 4-hydroxylase subunit alpha-2-like [Dermacentor andersoni]|uniref:prolyl 4-hydroxylase subunit alpha-2-like n=1 Tax=Dermacentor andersoni TaxID=34620 RepID=UPI002155A04F|nr:prolyl 4-hydroxylase subunit alpha-2-like [Dermacentor andersoni]